MSDHYVECDHCGHPIEQHGLTGCKESFDGEGCGCDTRWTVKEIQRVRRESGLPGSWWAI